MLLHLCNIEYRIIHPKCQDKPNDLPDAMMISQLQLWSKYQLTRLTRFSPLDENALIDEKDEIDEVLPKSRESMNALTLDR